jgi:hypothetical protein
MLNVILQHLMSWLTQESDNKQILVSFLQHLIGRLEKSIPLPSPPHLSFF